MFSGAEVQLVHPRTRQSTSMMDRTTAKSSDILPSSVALPGKQTWWGWNSNRAIGLSKTGGYMGLSTSGNFDKRTDENALQFRVTMGDPRLDKP